MKPVGTWADGQGDLRRTKPRAKWGETSSRVTSWPLLFAFTQSNRRDSRFCSTSLIWWKNIRKGLVERPSFGSYLTYIQSSKNRVRVLTNFLTAWVGHVKRVRRGLRSRWSRALPRGRGQTLKNDPNFRHCFARGVTRVMQWCHR